MPSRILMTERHRIALLALPDTEVMVVRHHLGVEDLTRSALHALRQPA